jgi:hypothetical protein
MMEPKLSDVTFAIAVMWVRILNLPFGWMNDKRGASASGLIGKVMKVKAHENEKVSSPFLWARIAVDMNKPLRRGINHNKDKMSLPSEWFDIYYENMSFFCFSCDLIGHLENLYPTLQPKDTEEKLSYEKKKFHTPDDRKKKDQSFA